MEAANLNPATDNQPISADDRGRIGEALRRIREFYGETQTSFARKLDVSRATYVQLEKGNATDQNFDRALEVRGISRDEAIRIYERYHSLFEES